MLVSVDFESVSQISRAAKGKAAAEAEQQDDTMVYAGTRLKRNKDEIVVL